MTTTKNEQAIVTILTTDGELRVMCEKDQYDCVKAVFEINGEIWADIFVGVDEFKEFIDELPIVEVLEYAEPVDAGIC